MSNSKDDFVRLFVASESSIRRYAMSLLADWNVVDDIVQDASVAMYNKFDQYDPAQPFVNWACRFAYYEVLNYRKREKQRRTFPDSLIETIAAQPVANNEQSDARRRALNSCLEKLVDDERELIQIRYATPRSISEVASDIGMPAGHLYKRLGKIRKTLLTCIASTIKAELDAV